MPNHDRDRFNADKYWMNGCNVNATILIFSGAAVRSPLLQTEVHSEVSPRWAVPHSAQRGSSRLNKPVKMLSPACHKPS
jgi:hypothetical protein